jgi:GNAT superfamily N-acetyltransferase
MTEGDLGAVDELRRLAGWNQTPDDWRRLLELEPEGCFLAEVDGELAGTVTTTAYGQDLAWIGMMLVHPKHRRQGIATRLMSQAIEYLRGRAVRCLRLDATPAGYPLYEKLGFIPEWTLTRCLRPPLTEVQTPVASSEARGSRVESPEGRGSRVEGRGPRGSRVEGHLSGVPSSLAPRPSSLAPRPSSTREMADADWEAVEELDAAACGARRPALLRGLARHSVKALVWPGARPAAGWGLLRGGANADYLGPVACPRTEGAIALVTDLLRGTGPRPVIWDVPDGNEAAKASAQRFGFAPVRSLTRMRLGPDAPQRGPGAQFAIADPAVG